MGGTVADRGAEEDSAMVDRYARVVLTVIAFALVGLLVRPMLEPRPVIAQTDTLIGYRDPQANRFVIVTYATPLPVTVVSPR
jgi:hypothetical protein